MRSQGRFTLVVAAALALAGCAGVGAVAKPPVDAATFKLAFDSGACKVTTTASTTNCDPARARGACAYLNRRGGVGKSRVVFDATGATTSFRVFFDPFGLAGIVIDAGAARALDVDPDLLPKAGDDLVYKFGVEAAGNGGKRCIEDPTIVIKP